MNLFRETLLKRQEIIKKRNSESISSIELDQTKVGRLSRMDAMQQKEMAEAARRLSSIELQKIEVALEKIESGDYGYCINCDENISEGRIQKRWMRIRLKIADFPSIF
jgi:DnaK suppressor protein